MKHTEDHHCPDRNGLLNQTRINIRQYGVQIISITHTDYSPPFSYSIGLYERFQHPEIICFGLTAKLSQTILNHVTEVVQKGQRIQLSNTYPNVFFKESRCKFLKVDRRNIGDYFGIAQSYYQDEAFPALQLVWTDRNDKFPWEDGFEEVFEFDQPLLDRNAEFKFREPRNLGIYTTRQWLELEQPIVTVLHERNGDWQFLTAEPLAEEDYILVGLEHILQRDPTLNEVFDLQYGQAADRKFIGDEWVFTALEDNDQLAG